MLRQPLIRRPKPDVCQVCKSLGSRRITTPAAQRTIHTAPRARRAGSSQISKLDQPETTRVRYASTTGAPSANARFQPTTKSKRQERQGLPDIDNLVRIVSLSTKSFLALDKIPKEEDIVAALRPCATAAAVLMDSKIQPLLKNAEHQTDTAATNLLELDGNSQEAAPTSSAVEGPRVSVTRIRDAIKTLSNAAYTIISHPNVFITPELLKMYVAIQARLGTPETLPHVLHLYATKPLPRESAGTITYAKENPSKISNAVDPEVAEVALDAAIEAKNLDVAVGVVEHTYASKASIRAKLVKKGFAPAGAAALFPVVAYSIASQVSSLQDTMDQSTGTFIAFAGIAAYASFTGMLGLIAATTANDQVMRVSWAKGTPLRQRWIREEERAALDKIACSFGFSESHRFGEEEGTQFQALREYILTKGMVLDSVDLMEDLTG